MKFELIKRSKNFEEGFNISDVEDVEIWIYCEDGEGGRFNKKKFYDCIKKFYKENF